MTWKEERDFWPIITRVDALDGDCFDVTLSNGHAILLDLSSRIHEPEFAQLIADRLFDRPKTDGQRIYWAYGPTFTLADILAFLAQDT